MTGRGWIILSIALGMLMLVAIVSVRAGPPGQPPVLDSQVAPLGTAFTYQGKLVQSDTPVAGTCDFQFSLYDDAATGTQIGTTQSLGGVGVEDGVFTVQLDFGDGAFQGDGRWLQIAVRCPAGSGSYTTLAPRQPLTPAPYALALPGLWTQQNSTSPNLIGGYSGNSVAPGVYGATISGGGFAAGTNQATANYAAIGGGGSHTASGSFSTISGGWGNAASGLYATVSGGADNTAREENATVGGGYGNTASGLGSTVGGGLGDTASGHWSTVGGGLVNATSGEAAAIGGGQFISVTSQAATVAGGDHITVTGDFAAVGGGEHISVTGRTATAAGGSTVVVSGDYAAVGGGRFNSVTANYGTIAGGGYADSAWGNRVTDEGGTISGGGNNQAGNGTGPTTDAYYATVGGGWDNIASKKYATVPGGEGNTAAGDHSLAAGHRAKANNTGCFVWGDSTNADVSCNDDDRWVARASGGVYFYSSSDLGHGVYLAEGADSWSPIWTSDRDQKVGFVPVDGGDIVARLAEVPITTWSYAAGNPTVRHIGPVSQDFYTAFGLGEDDGHISAVDANGVALAAIQGLYAQNQALEAENATLQAQLADLEARVVTLEQSSAPSHQAQIGLPLEDWLGLAGLLIGLGAITSVSRRRREAGQ